MGIGKWRCGAYAQVSRIRMSDKTLEVSVSRLTCHPKTPLPHKVIVYDGNVGHDMDVGHPFTYKRLISALCISVKNGPIFEIKTKMCGEQQLQEDSQLSLCSKEYSWIYKLVNFEIVKMLFGNFKDSS